MNLWSGTGRLVKDPEMTETTTNKKFVNFTIAVPKQYNKSQADFVDCQVWNKSAEYLMKFGKKGMRIEAQGPISTNINGDNKYTVVVANNIDLIFENNNNETKEDTQEEPKSSYDKIPEKERPF